MATQYTSDRYGTKQILSTNIDANQTAAHTAAIVKFFSGVVVTEARIGNIVASTTANAGFNIYKGTTSIGAVTVGTTTEGAFNDATLTDTTLASTDTLTIKNVASDATFKGTLLLDYHEVYTYTD